MSEETLRRVPVWSPLLRLLHWALALAVAGLIGSGWLLRHDLGALGQAPAEVHRNLGYVALALLGVRAYLLFFGRGPEHWRDLVPDALGLRAAGQMLRFYLTLARAPLPAYYAHNPLWGPLHLAFYVLLAAQGLSALAGETHWHVVGYRILSALVLAHVITAFVHDWKGTSAEISAMVSGHKIFLVSRPAPPPSVSVSLQPPVRGPHG
jgi:Ni/Fe-hydrogenase 1 B-type cytochrome subunit